MAAPAAPGSTTGYDEATRRSQVRRALVGSTIGTSIEWYDFFLYGTAAALVFPKLFFPGAGAYAGILASFATYAVGFAARPLGAFIFGHWGDRVGRKTTLIISLLVMGLASAAIGMLPGYKALGFWAPVLLVVLRIVQGIGVGGEWGGSVVLALEWGDKNRRGLVGSWPQLGVPIGLLLSAGAVSLFTSISGSHFDSWGWRVPFLLSLLLVLVGLWIRTGVLESPIFEQARARDSVERAPSLVSLARDWRPIVLSAFLRMSEQMPFYILTVFILSYGTKQLHFDKQFLVNATLVAAALSLVMVPLFGGLSDRVGRRRMYLTGAVLTGVLAVPYFLLVDHGSALVVFVVIALSLVPHDMQYGPQAAYIAENFTTERRYSGAGMGYQFASVVAGGPAPLVAAYLLHTFGTSMAIAVYIIAGAVVTVVAAALIGDRTNADLTTVDPYPQQPATSAASSPSAARR